VLESTIVHSFDNDDDDDWPVMVSDGGDVMMTNDDEW
jgi:hypothetical protein